MDKPNDAVNHPPHYGGANNPYEVIKVIRAWGLNFNLGNTLKYIARAGKKDQNKLIEDLEKALWYLQDEINHLKEVRKNKENFIEKLVNQRSEEITQQHTEKRF